MQIPNFDSNFWKISLYDNIYQIILRACKIDKKLAGTLITRSIFLKDTCMRLFLKCIYVQKSTHNVNVMIYFVNTAVTLPFNILIGG